MSYKLLQDSPQGTLVFQQMPTATTSGTLDGKGYLGSDQQMQSIYCMTTTSTIMTATPFYYNPLTSTTSTTSTTWANLTSFPEPAYNTNVTGTMYEDSYCLGPLADSLCVTSMPFMYVSGGNLCPGDYLGFGPTTAAYPGSIVHQLGMQGVINANTATWWTVPD
jgi:hypothetical protein